EVALALGLLLCGGRELITVVVLILAGVAKDQEAVRSAPGERNGQEDGGQQHRRAAHDAPGARSPTDGGPILHVSPTRPCPFLAAAGNSPVQARTCLGIAPTMRRNRGSGGLPGRPGTML